MNRLDNLAWFELCLVLAAGSTVIVLAAALACRATSSPRWQRSLWQISVLAVLGLVMSELTGLGSAITAMAKLRFEISDFRFEISNLKSETSQRLLVAHAIVPRPLVASIGEEILEPSESAAAQLELNQDERHTSQFGATNGGGMMETGERGLSLRERTSDRGAKGDDYAAGPILASVWATISLLILGRVTVGHWLLARFARRHRILSAQEFSPRIAMIAARLGLRRKIRVLEATCLTGPIAFGIVRPTVGLPRSFAADFTPAEQDAMLAHELAHLAGRDPLWHLLADVAVAALWWQPLSWRLRSRLQAANEAAADEASLLVKDGPRTLAECLVLLARRVQQQPALRWVSIQGSGFRSSLARRVVRLVSLKERAWHRPHRASHVLMQMFGTVALVMAVLFFTAGARTQPDSKGEPAMKLMQESWQRSLAGMLVLAAMGPTAPATAQEREKPAAERREEQREGERRPDAERRDGERRPEAERREGERPAPERRDGDRPAPERRDGDRPAAERRDGDRPDQPRREADRPGGERREGEAQRAERAEVEAKLAAMQRELAKLAEAGKKDEAEKVGQAIRAMRERLEAALQGGRRDADRPAAANEGDRRGAPRDSDRPVARDGDRPAARGDGRRPDDTNPRPDAERGPGDHLRVAIENLRAAGKHEIAAALEGESRREGGRPPEGGRPTGAGGQQLGTRRLAPEGPGGAPAELMNVLREMRGELQNLRNEVNELRAKVKELSGKEGAR